MARILLTGMSGTGTSTVLRRLAERGHHVVDTDDPGWSYELPTPDGGVEQLWDEQRMAELLASDREGALFVSGCARNQVGFYDRFDAVVLLSAPADVLLARLSSRTTNDFGRRPEERERILQDLAQVEPRLRATATLELDTRLPLEQVVDAVEQVSR